MSRTNLPHAMRLLRKVDPNPIGTMLAGPFQGPPPIESWLPGPEADAQAAASDLHNLGVDFEAALRNAAEIEGLGKWVQIVAASAAKAVIVQLAAELVADEASASQDTAEAEKAIVGAMKKLAR